VSWCGRLFHCLLRASLLPEEKVGSNSCKEREGETYEGVVCIVEGGEVGHFRGATIWVLAMAEERVYGIDGVGLDGVVTLSRPFVECAVMGCANCVMGDGCGGRGARGVYENSTGVEDGEKKAELGTGGGDGLEETYAVKMMN
jgi:hypothetical protein